MALRLVTAELRSGGQGGRDAGAAVSDLPGVADALGRVLALVARSSPMMPSHGCTNSAWGWHERSTMRPSPD